MIRTYDFSLFTLELTYDPMLYMIIDAIESYIEHYNQSINQNNKQTYGEVFTPFTLVRTMVNSIPIHIWRNPRLQWLDPANGTGHFMMIVFSRLWRELREWEPDDLKRETHILTKMLFMVEINETNVDFSPIVWGKSKYISAILFHLRPNI